MLEPGDKAPAFTLPDQDGNKVKLSDFKGETVVLYFYPRADTPGCTTQACGIRDRGDEYAKLGAKVVHKGNARVHVSGHAAAGELLYCYNILRPRNVLPVHGEYRHLTANAALAVETGVPESSTFVGENGVVLDLAHGDARVVGQLDLGYVYVDGSTVGEITDADLKDRRILAEEGFISIFVAVDTQTGRVIVGPEIQARGFAEDESVFDDVRPQIVKALSEAAR